MKQGIVPLVSTVGRLFLRCHTDGHTGKTEGTKGEAKAGSQLESKMQSGSSKLYRKAKFPRHAQGLSRKKQIKHEISIPESVEMVKRRLEGIVGDVLRVGKVVLEQLEVVESGINREASWDEAAHVEERSRMHQRRRQRLCWSGRSCCRAVHGSFFLAAVALGSAALAEVFGFVRGGGLRDSFHLEVMQIDGFDKFRTPSNPHGK